MGEVKPFTGLTRLNLLCERVLEAAKQSNLTSCIVLGYDKDGDTYMASSIADGGEVIWLMEKCKFRLMQLGEYDDN